MSQAEREDFLPDTVEGCRDEIEEYQSNIDSIAAQISLHDEGIIETDDETWKSRAFKAMVHNKRSVKELERQIKYLNGEAVEELDIGPANGDLKRKINLLEGKLNSVEKQLADARESNAAMSNRFGRDLKKRVAKVQFSADRQNYANAKLKQYIAEIAPELLPGAHACLSLAQAEFDATRNKGENE